ncbi:MAG: thioesterase family protein [Acidobacteriota bacterium]|nr:thioesterase family protein [Acidobacteriota bacterium]
MSRSAESATIAEGRATTRVRYPETDRMGVAHHSHYLAWFEIGRTELMREAGCPYGELEDDGIFFPVIRVEAVYRSPARYDEIVMVSTRLVAVGGATVRFEYTITRDTDGTVLATGASEHAAVDRRGRPRRLPAMVRQKLMGVREKRS